MAKTVSLPKQLSGKCETLLFTGVKQAGSYEPEKVMPHIEESFTSRNVEVLSAFLKWVVSHGRKFGRGNIQTLYREFRSSQT